MADAMKYPQPITEGRMSKGGRNELNPNAPRPKAPEGSCKVASDGKLTEENDKLWAAIHKLENELRVIREILEQRQQR